MKKVIACLPFGVLAFVVWLAYRRLLEMYFWRDDYTHLYLGQQGEIFKFPYHILSLLARWGWGVFGLEVRGYFLVAIILYVLAVWLVFYLMRLWFGRKDLAFLCALVMAAGYVGEDGMKMLLGDGWAALVSLDAFLLGLVSLFIYLKKRGWWWMVGSYGFYWLALEAMAHRMAGLVLIMVVGDWIFSGRGKWKQVVARNVGFVAIFLVEYLVQPSRLWWGYGVGEVVERLGLLSNFQWSFLVNFAGNLGNLFFPSVYIEKWWQFLGEKVGMGEWQFWLSSLPVVGLAVVLMGVVGWVKRGSLSGKKWGIGWVGFWVWFGLWGVLVRRWVSDRLDMVFGFNGGIWLGFLAVLLLWRVPKFLRETWFALVIAVGLVSVFLLSRPDFLLVSNHRYLLVSAVVPTLAMTFFISDELDAEKRKRRAAWGLFLLPVLVFSGSRLLAGIETQSEFVEEYSVPAKGIFEGLKKYLPSIDKKTVIYIEGATRELNYSVGDASRVGTLGSEAAFAVNYDTKKEKVILPENLGMIPEILRKNPDLGIEDVYTFIYGETGLQETSGEMRELLRGEGGKGEVRIPATWWEREEGSEAGSLRFVPRGQILTMLPIDVVIWLMVVPEKGVAVDFQKDVKVSWEYNTYGLLGEEREVHLLVKPDGQWREYEWVIPAGGEMLKKIEINYGISSSVRVSEGKWRYVY